jgi:predicted DNA-binding ribbon-helix-helix protein
MMTAANERQAAMMTAADRTTDSAIRKRSVVIAGHRTSISLEEAFWVALRDAAQRRGVSVNGLVAAIDAARQPEQPGNLSSALRVFVLDCFRRGELPVRAGSATLGDG